MVKPKAMGCNLSRPGLIQADDLRLILGYDPATGLFTWLVDFSFKCRKGMPAGCGPKPDGYIYIQIRGIRYLAHVLAWVWMTGSYPDSDLDHEDTIRSHNWWSNLRQASRSQNNANCRLHSHNKSGVKGVCWDARRGRWRAYVTKDNRQHTAGSFNSKDEAVAARAAMATKLFGSFARA